MANGAGGGRNDRPRNRASGTSINRSAARREFRFQRAMHSAATLIRRLGWRRILLGSLLFTAFSCGFYLAHLYNEISQLIALRLAALTSAMYSAPLVISVGDDI